MAGGSNTITTVSDLQKGYRKKATKLYPAFKAMVEEFSWLDDISDEDITVSGRENLIPLDIKRGYGAHMVSDGGYEARTVTPAMNEGSFTFSELNSRFYISRRAKALDQRSKEAQIIAQIKYQSKKSMEALARRVGLNFYGHSTALVCETTTNATATTQTLTLNDGFGDSTIDDTTYLSSLFEVGDRVAGLDASNSNALLSNALGEVTAKISAGIIEVTFDGSVDVDAADYLTFANGVTDTTITASDYNKWQPGLLEITTASTLHSLATSSEANWAAALNDTNGGRFGRVKLKKARQEIYNDGGGKLTDVVWSNGVENDVEAGEAAGRIYDSSSFDLDQSVKAKGVTFRTSQLVPPGHVFAFDRSGWGKKLLTDKPAEDGQLDFGSAELFKAEDRSGFKGGFTFMWAQVCRSRAKFVRYASLTEQ
jgi:hypothetical protein